jgi:hypothetical protein
MALFTPIANYAGYEHCLNAMPCFTHPNGNVYGVVVAKRGGKTQNLEIYRVRPGSLNRELVHTYVGGGPDAVSQIAAGGCTILQNGSLWAWASAVPQTSPNITQTGFVGGFWPPIPGVDAPWSIGAAAPPVGQAVTIPPGSPLDSIWTPAYTAAECDTPEKIAVKLTKNNDQWEQLISLLKQAGVLV